ncbi:hypothetical protein AJ87_08225 [Rhizobium yanglingense]|nr:hypothetical protein AJ87_08225 [Rhizobium yanglingense]
MSPLILETNGRQRLALGGAGSERILGSLTYLLFLRFGLGLPDDMVRLMSNPRLFPRTEASEYIGTSLMPSERIWRNVGSRLRWQITTWSVT